MLAELVLDAHHLVAGAVGRHDEGADAALAGRRIGDGEDDHRAGVLAGGDELLGAVEHVAVAVATGAGAQVAGVGAGLRLGEGEGADLLAARQRDEEAALLLVVAEAQDRHAAHRVVHAHDGRAGAVAGGDLLQRQGIGLVAGVAAAQLLRYQHAEEAELAHLADRLGGIAMLAIPLLGERAQALLGELASHLADTQLIVGQQHGQSPQSRRSTAMAVASPPPMQMAATPRRRPWLRSAASRVTRMRAPEAPIGWPRAQAPP
ncbi:hypothetical protein D3C80_1260190 [compost metagenome]